MADYYQVKNQNIFNPPSSISLGSTSNQFSNMYVENDLILGNITVTGETIIAPRVTTITYPGNDTAADTAGGQTITLTGTGFVVGANILINSSAVSVVSVVSSTVITFISPANAAGSYVIYVINPDGSTAIAIPGIQYSGTPIWTTTAGSLGNVYETVGFNQTVTATGDAPITYAVYSGTLPPGATFNSTGTITGTSQVLSSPTTYTFTVRATDAQLQDTNRSFSLTIIPDVVTWSSPANNASYTPEANIAISNITLIATSAAGSGITYSANTLPTGLSLTGATISGTPTVIASTSSLLTATANTTNESSSITINWSVSVASDPYFMYTPLLLAGNGTNGAQNNTILDSSTNNYAITRAGNTTQGTFTPFGPNWSNYFSGASSTWLAIPINATFAFGTNNYTYEAWVYPTSFPNAYNTVFCNFRDDEGTKGWSLLITSTGLIHVNNQGTYNNSTNVVSLNAWTHIAVCRVGNTVTRYINGVADPTTLTVTASITNVAAHGITIGGSPEYSTAREWNGYISNARVISGTALYTSNFTPSTTPLTAITNTSLLTCQSNRFIDNSTNAFAITLSGTPSVQHFSPFSPDSAYTTSTIGGAISLQSSNLEFSRDSVQFGTGDFTIEFWINPSTVSSTTYMFNRAWNGANFFMIDLTPTAQMELWFGHPASNWFTTVSTSSPAPFKANQWHHVALTRSGTSVKAFVNGVAVITGTSSVNLTNGDTTTCYIGKYWYYPNVLANGYVSNFRAVTGTAVYTANFTPPTAPLTAISGTSLLLSATNAGIFDNAMMNNVVTVGNAQISTAQSKFGGSSISLDGTGDYLSSSDNLTLAFGSGAFTVEGWIYLINTSGTKGIVFGGGNNSFGLRIGQSYNGNVNGLNIAKSGIADLDYCAFTFATNTWYHIAVVRSGTTIYFFVNGTQQTTQGSGAGSFSFVNPTSGFYIGCNNDTNEQFAGYIDDFRITKGYARYTSNFTAPTSAFLLK
jgi:hypothetical protein